MSAICHMNECWITAHNSIGKRCCCCLLCCFFLRLHIWWWMILKVGCRCLICLQNITFISNLEHLSPHAIISLHPHSSFDLQIDISFVNESMIKPYYYRKPPSLPKTTTTQPATEYMHLKAIIGFVHWKNWYGFGDHSESKCFNKNRWIKWKKVEWKVKRLPWALFSDQI